MNVQTHDLFYPMLVMFVWTFLILLRNVQVRVGAVLKGELTNEYFRAFPRRRALRPYSENAKPSAKSDGDAAVVLHRRPRDQTISQKNLADGDLRFTDFKKLVDEYVSKAGLTCPEETSSRQGGAEPDEVLRPIREVDLKAAGISSIVWATGFRSDFEWVKLPIFDDGGEPVHERGVTSLPGIYFLGIKWLYKRKSHFMANAGPAEDAAYLVEHIKNRAEQNWS